MLIRRTQRSPSPLKGERAGVRGENSTEGIPMLESLSAAPLTLNPSPR